MEKLHLNLACSSCKLLAQDSGLLSPYIDQGLLAKNRIHCSWFKQEKYLLQAYCKGLLNHWESRRKSFHDKLSRTKSLSAEMGHQRSFCLFCGQKEAGSRIVAGSCYNEEPATSGSCTIPAVIHTSREASCSAF